MVEVISLIASVIAIAKWVNEGVKHAKTFYRAAEEFEAFQASSTLGALQFSSLLFI